MTIGAYISQKLSSFGVQLREADLLDIELTNSLSAQDDVSVSNKRAVDVALARFIPTIMARQDVSEGGMSISWDRNALKEYYGMMCQDLGIENRLTPRKTVRFA